MDHKLLENINSPSELRALPDSEMDALAAEIRDFLIETVNKRGGHLASNLGVVELTLALHRVFDSPTDRIIFDVGHQAYVHKLITGRRAEFDALRVPGGLSGFTSRRESEHDPFGAGHSSTSVSAALGFAEADAIAGRAGHTVCVIGDGAYTGGMVHEALNNCKPELPMVIILNENGMSISLNKGTFASYLSRVRISGKYRSWKRGTNTLLSHIPLIGGVLRKLVGFTKEAVKKLIYRPNYFEELGLYYIGPIDGNDYKKVYNALTTAKEIGKTCVVHVKTTKGKGYYPAESSPDGYHSIGTSKSPSTYHSVFADKLASVAENNSNVCAVTAAMGIGTGLDRFEKRHPDRYFDVGIAEGHALTFSAGLAAAGLSPFVAIYSTFLQRGYDSIIHDIALQSLPVKIMIDRAGLSVGDGATHHGIFDVSFLSHIPDMTLLAPISYSSLESMVDYALECKSPIAIRYPNASENPELNSSFTRISEDILGLVSVDFDAASVPKYVFITYGKIYERVVLAKKILEEKGIDAGVIVTETIKPYTPTARLIAPLINNATRVIYVEEGIKNGGAAMITLEELKKFSFDVSSTEYIIAAIDDNFATPSEECELYSHVGLSPQRLAELMEKG